MEGSPSSDEAPRLGRAADDVVAGAPSAALVATEWVGCILMGVIVQSESTPVTLVINNTRCMVRVVHVSNPCHVISPRTYTTMTSGVESSI